MRRIYIILLSPIIIFALMGCNSGLEQGDKSNTGPTQVPVEGVDSPLTSEGLQIQVISVNETPTIGEEWIMMPGGGGVGTEEGFTWLIIEVDFSDVQEKEQLINISENIVLVNPTGDEDKVFITRFDHSDLPNAKVSYLFMVPEDSNSLDLVFPDGQKIALDSLLVP